MRLFLLAIQSILISFGMFLLISLPFASTFYPDGFPYIGPLFNISFSAVFLLMVIRPLGDLLGWAWLRRLIILRKGLGILSASIIVGFMIGKVIAPDSTYLSTMFSLSFFSLDNFAFFAHIGDVTGLLLLITSNTLSQRLFRGNWKRIQRLSYVYFYAGGVYEAFPLRNGYAFIGMMIVTILTFFAWRAKTIRREEAAQAAESAKQDERMRNYGGHEAIL